ncbi:histidine kinase [Actinomadura sp. DC4]|uniref:sensor histidine kinase n=1 Tax=Actinomadura sp. DC4 TaxID=3055069 RepID=UPI0025B13C4C|nr:histidine kinase [Actinomadura sp. DC4]MDN3356892.1 histidine kinase [Actinomadura sp. DC4]
MQLRTLTAAVALLALLPTHEVASLVLLVCLAALSWIAARYWQRIVSDLLAHPVLVAVDVAASFTVLEVGGVTGPYFLSTVITAAVAGLLFRWPGMVAISVVQVLWYYLTLAAVSMPAADMTFQAVIGQPLFYPLIGFAGTALRKLIDDQAEAQAAAATAEERARLAREMHDSLAKTLRGIALAAGALPMWTRRDPDRAAAEACRIAAGVEIASREMRDLITGLRDDSATLPLPLAVRAVANRWREEHGVGLRCDIDPAVALPPRECYEVVAICSEALANVARHAEAMSVLVRLGGERDAIVLTISDDGRGFRLKSLEDLAREGHYGLLGLKERGERAGGVVSVVSRPGEGTTVTVRLPAGRVAPDDLTAAGVA